MTITDAEVEAISDERLALLIATTPDNPRQTMTMFCDALHRIFTELQSLRAASQARALSSGGGWQDIATAPRDEPIMLGKWVPEDGFWYWQASGQVTDRGLWIDFMDDDFAGTNFQAPTHWRPLGKSPQPPSKDNTNE